MLQVTLLRPAGGAVTPVPRYPFRIGRAADDQMRLQVPGVWDRHCTLEWRGSEGVHLVGDARALTLVNGQPVKEVRVRNGDIVDVGGVQLMLSVCPVPQRHFGALEFLVWLTLSTIALSQLFLMLVGLP
jgi:pSer/pThr/pTyr-binding forkhead associated (FHA) protein